MPKLVVVGYGQMGRLVDELASRYGFEVVSRIDPHLGTAIRTEDLHGARIAVEFTEPSAAASNVRKCLELGLKVVSGTTGWFEELEKIREEYKDTPAGLVVGSNFSLGMNLFYRITAAASEIINQSEDYDVYGYELHHKLKKDSPSGTARNLAAILLEHFITKDEVEYEALHEQRKPNVIHFSSIRGGNFPGEHRIGFDSEYDTIELKHTARNRKGLAAGALLAARFIYDRSGFYHFNDILEEL